MAYLLAPEAEGDLDEIWLYTATESGRFEIADRIIDSITDCIFLLARHPHVGRRRDEDLRPGLRSFSVGEYIIIYRVEDDAARILRVLRGSRDIQRLLRP